MIGIGFVSLATHAAAAVGDVILVSTSAEGEKGNDTSFFPSLSGDGGTLAFHSVATNLDPADTDQRGDVYVKDLSSGSLLLASTSDGGVKGDLSSLEPSLSADASAVAFASQATNLDPADVDSDYDIYVKNLASGDIVLATTSDLGVKSNGLSYKASLSADGNLVAFYTDATNLDPADTDSDYDVYVKNLATGDLMLVSTSSGEVKGDGMSFIPSLSADGTAVAFVSAASNLDPSDEDDIWDVYVKDLATGGLFLASTSDTGIKGDQYSDGPSLSADGEVVAISSAATNFDPDDADASPDIYVKNLATGDIVLASTSDAGVKADAMSDVPTLSGDGNVVAFRSYASNLDPADPEMNQDVYAKYLDTGDVRLVSSSDTGVRADGFSEVPAALPSDGSTVAFVSYASNLDPADTDGFEDVYVKTFVPVPSVTISIKDRSRLERDAVNRLSFRVRLSAPGAEVVTVHFATVDGTAASGSDFTFRSGTIAFAPGRTKKRIFLQVLGDHVAESDETFTVELSDPTGAGFGDDEAVGTLRNDDPASPVGSDPPEVLESSPRGVEMGVGYSSTG